MKVGGRRIEYLSVFVMTHVTCQVPRQIYFDLCITDFRVHFCAILIHFVLVLIHYNCEAYQEIQRFTILHHRLEDSIYRFSCNELHSVLLNVCMRMWLTHHPLYTTLTLLVYIRSVLRLRAFCRPSQACILTNESQAVLKYPVWDVLNVCKVFVHV